MPSALKKIQSPDEILNRVQDGILPVINAILRDPLLDGRLLAPVALGASFTNVPHGLGRALRGWQIVDINASATVWSDPALPGPAANPDVTRFVRLKASAAASVTLWVF